MEEMKQFLEDMMDELDGAKKYKHLAHDIPEYKDHYKKMAMEELGHFKIIESILMNRMSEEQKELWNNEVTRLLYSTYTDKYEWLKEEIEQI